MNSLEANVSLGSQNQKEAVDDHGDMNTTNSGNNGNNSVSVKSENDDDALTNKIGAILIHDEGGRKSAPSGAPIVIPVDGTRFSSNSSKGVAISNHGKSAQTSSSLTIFKHPLSTKFKFLHLTKWRPKSDGGALIKHMTPPFLPQKLHFRRNVAGSSSTDDLKNRLKSSLSSFSSASKSKYSSFIKNFNGIKTQMEGSSSGVSFSQKISLDYLLSGRKKHRSKPRDSSHQSRRKAGVAPTPESNNAERCVENDKNSTASPSSFTVVGDDPVCRKSFRANSFLMQLERDCKEESEDEATVEGVVELWNCRILMGKKCKPLDLDDEDEITDHELSGNMLVVDHHGDSSESLSVQSFSREEMKEESGDPVFLFYDDSDVDDGSDHGGSSSSVASDDDQDASLNAAVS